MAAFCMQIKDLKKLNTLYLKIINRFYNNSIEKNIIKYIPKIKMTNISELIPRL